MPSSKNEFPEKKKVSIGRSYEKLAALFFKQNGFEILEHNWRAGKKEIDLIVKKGNLLIFVEVKSSTSKKYGHPAERIDKKKIDNLINAAQQYIISQNIHDVDLRFDVVTFVNGKLEHYPNAFEVS